MSQNQGDACSIIKQKKSWKSALKRLRNRVSPGMQLAFIKTESNFRPTELKIFSRSFPQVGFHRLRILKHLMGPGKNIKKRRYKYRRSNFAHSTNFIGWYIQTNKLLGISKNNAYLQYLPITVRQDLKQERTKLKACRGSKNSVSKKKFDSNLKNACNS